MLGHHARIVVKECALDGDGFGDTIDKFGILQEGAKPLQSLAEPLKCDDIFASCFPQEDFPEEVSISQR